MANFETIEIDAAVAACSGGGALGHPRVYLNLGAEGRVECPYCSRVYINPRLAGHTESSATTRPPAHG